MVDTLGTTHDHDHEHALLPDGASGSSFASGLIDPAALNIDAILNYRTGNNMMRWNFDQVVGQPQNSTAGIGSGVTIRYAFLDTPASYMPDNQGGFGSLSTMSPLTSIQKEEIRAALKSWSDVANITFQEISGAEAGAKMITFSKFAFAESQSNFSGYAYLPMFYVNTNGNIVTSVTPDNAAGDVYFNANHYPAGEGPSIFDTAVHEIGHALGLSHPFETSVQFPAEALNNGYTVMSYTDAKNMTWWRPEPDTNGRSAINEGIAINLGISDVKAIQHLYGANTSFNAGDTSYSWDPTRPVRMTLWDGGGNDTIDLSNFTLASDINLTPYTFSSIGIRSTDAELRIGVDPSLSWLPAAEIGYDGRNNVGIADGTLIENVVGGSHNDRVIGNAARNKLTGNAGDDWFDGGAGNDILNGGAGNDTLIGGVGLDVAVYSGSRGALTLSMNGNATVVTGIDGHDSLVGIDVLVFDNGQVASARQGLFDEVYYLDQNVDVAAAVRAGQFHSGAQHFGFFGKAEGRDPSAFFDFNYYLARNQDVAAAGVNAFDHFMAYGWHEGRDPSIYFDTGEYNRINPDVASAGVNGLEHFLTFGFVEGRQAVGVEQPWLV